jgi:hypothetical protein
MICKCMRLASRSAIESPSSANSGSYASSGVSSELDEAWRGLDFLEDSRSEEREEGRKGVVGRERGRRVLEEGRWCVLPAEGMGVDILRVFCSGDSEVVVL